MNFRDLRQGTGTVTLRALGNGRWVVGADLLLCARVRGFSGLDVLRGLVLRSTKTDMSVSSEEGLKPSYLVVAAATFCRPTT